MPCIRLSENGLGLLAVNDDEGQYRLQPLVQNKTNPPSKETAPAHFTVPTERQNICPQQCKVRHSSISMDGPSISNMLTHLLSRSVVLTYKVI